jgi:hypothetical protein
MRTADGNQINMALAVQKVLGKYKNVWSNHNAFSDQVAGMQRRLGIINEHQKNAEIVTEGVTKDKNNAAGYAIELGKDLAGSAYVYAKAIGNESLKAQFDVTKKSLLDTQEILAVSKLKELQVNLEAIAVELGDYVSRDELNAFNAAIINFESQIANPRVVIVGRGKSNEIVAATVKELKSTFDNMDKLVTKFKDTEFEKEYIHARIVIDLGTRKSGQRDSEEPKDEEAKDINPAA